MQTRSGNRSDPAAKVRAGKMLQLAGLMDVGLGVALPLLGPEFAPDMDPYLKGYWWYAGAFFIVTGLGLAAYGHVVARRARESR